MLHGVAVRSPFLIGIIAGDDRISVQMAGRRSKRETKIVKRELSGILRKKKASTEHDY